MTKDEALRLALEALENAEYGDYYKKELNEAITAIKEALAQPEQEPCCYGGIAHDCHAGEGCRIVKRMKATSPQRTWVNATTWRGLTDEEVKDIVWNLPYEPSQEDIRAIEAKLKAKNSL